MIAIFTFPDLRHRPSWKNVASPLTPANVVAWTALTTLSNDFARSSPTSAATTSCPSSRPCRWLKRTSGLCPICSTERVRARAFVARPALNQFQSIFLCPVHQLHRSFSSRNRNFLGLSDLDFTTFFLVQQMYLQLSVRGTIWFLKHDGTYNSKLFMCAIKVM